MRYADSRMPAPNLHGDIIYAESEGLSIYEESEALSAEGAPNAAETMPARLPARDDLYDRRKRWECSCSDEASRCSS